MSSRALTFTRHLLGSQAAALRNPDQIISDTKVSVDDDEDEAQGELFWKPKKKSSPSPSPSASFGDDDVVIVGIARTPMGSFNGKLSSLSAVDLGAAAIKGSLSRSKIQGSDVDIVYMGNVLSANVGQAPARQAALKAGIPVTAPATTVNKVCASGMKAIMMAASDIKLGNATIAVAGGMESMSNAPYYLPRVRQGLRMGDGKVVDGMMKDGLFDPYGQYPMGVIAEKTAEKHSVSREQQDAYAVSSFQRAAQAWKTGMFEGEVIPVEVPQRRGKPPVIVKEDEGYTKVDIKMIPKLRGVFGRGQTVTAANASSISDGAAAVVLCSGAEAKKRGLSPVAILRSWADAATTPDDFPTAPSLAVPLALKRAGVSSSEVDLFEVNEAFAVVCVANQKILGLDSSKVNIAGGGVSIGHPIGCSGARIVVTLANLLEKKNGRIGCAGICNGGGGASAVVIQRL